LEHNLTYREQQILNIVIEHYSKTSIPVSSVYISSRYREDGRLLSSATIRNTMSTMAGKGVIEKTHHSSGRIPSNLGYCLYVENLKNNYNSLESSHYLEKLHKYTSSAVDTRSLLMKHLDFLSDETGFATLLLLPDFFSLKLMRIEFIQLSKKRLMIILISTSGLHRQVMLKSETPIVYEEIVAVGNYINKNYYGYNLYDIKRSILRQMQSHLDKMSEVSYKLLLASYSCVQAMDVEENSNLIVKGIANLLGNDLKDVSALHRLVESFEQKKQIIDIISKCLDTNVSVIIDNDFADDLSLVVSPYGLESGMKGAFGLVGPRTMDYRNIMATMKCLTENVIETIIKI